MTVLGHNITSINASRKYMAANKIDINSVPKVTGVKEREMEIPGVLSEKARVLAIEFEFETEYKPEIGNIKITGDLIYTGNDNKKVVKDWEKSKNLPQDVDIEIKNFLLRKCLLLGVSISQEMQLPPPLLIPMMKTKKDSSPDYIG
jgi:hypothetical protein